jgi:hypothetical protein
MEVYDWNGCSVNEESVKKEEGEQRILGRANGVGTAGVRDFGF